MRVLVIGGAGYIGSVVVRELRRRGHQPVVYDNLCLGHPESVPPDVPLVRGDLGDRQQLAAAFDRHTPEAVMHFAAFSAVGESMREPATYFENNVAGVSILLKSMLEHGIQRFVFSSTAAVYGEPDVMPITETTPQQPTNPYGESKAMVERMLAWLSQLSGLRYAALRYFNAASAADGIGEDHRNETHLVPIVLQTALGQREAVTIFGDDYPTRDGTCVRDYIHVSDLATAHVLALDALDRGNLVCNLGSESGATVREVVDTAKRVTSVDFPVVVGPRRAGDPASLVASRQRAQHPLGWQPEHSTLEEIVTSAWLWHRSHPRGYQSN